MRVVLRFLVVVMLLTVLSPKFGWDSLGAMSAHVHAAGMSADGERRGGQDAAHDHGHETMADCHGHRRSGAEVDSGDHHCCPGHVLGHLLGGLGAQIGVPSIVPAAVMPEGIAKRYSSRIPEGLERPPRTAA